jgi:hypothetical protein
LGLDEEVDVCGYKIRVGRVRFHSLEGVGVGGSEMTQINQNKMHSPPQTSKTLKKTFLYEVKYFFSCRRLSVDNMLHQRWGGGGG